MTRLMRVLPFALFFLSLSGVAAVEPQVDKSLTLEQESDRNLRGNRSSYDEKSPTTLVQQAWRSLGWWMSSMNGNDGDGSSNPSTDVVSTASSDPNVITRGLQSDCNKDDTSRFNICLDLPDADSYWANAFFRAKGKWESVIVGDLPSRPGSGISKVNSRCAGYPSKIDDVYICGVTERIDGNYNIIGSGSWRRARNEGGKVTSYTGFMRFDSDDVSRLINEGRWENMIRHEMGHVLGVGTLWNDNDLYQNGSGKYKPGTNAQREWRDSVGCTGGTVPVEIGSDGGSPNAHWDERCMKNELMTGVASGNMALSRVTIGTLDDMGYRVNYNAADRYTRNDLGNCVINGEDYCKAGAQPTGGSNNNVPSSSTGGGNNNVPSSSTPGGAGSIGNSLDSIYPLFSSEFALLGSSSEIPSSLLNPSGVNLVTSLVGSSSEAAWLDDTLLRSVHDYARKEFETMQAEDREVNLVDLPDDMKNDRVNDYFMNVLVEGKDGKIHGIPVSRDDVR